MTDSATDNRWNHLWINARIATMSLNGSQGGSAYGMIEHGAIATQGDRIVWAGNMSDLPGEPAALAEEVTDCNGQLVTPGLIDCHTHLVYGGDRSAEFEMRLNGASYEEIARAGGGIVSTVKATRAASEDELYEHALPRLKRLMADGVTTVEIKSGYGLALEHEAKQLRVARKLGNDFSVSVKTTFLGAHALPPEYQDRSDDYIDMVCNEMLPVIHAEGLADCVDAFCEGIGFSVAQTERVFEAAKKHSLPVKLHAEQLSDLGGSGLAARYNALSADHLEYLNSDDIAAMKASGTVAVVLPGAFYCLRETKLPPIQALRDAGVPIALATDCNPGSSPVVSLLLMLSMGCTLFHMTPEETLAGVTRNAAKALGIIDEVGTLEVGKRADLVLWRAKNPAQLSYLVADLPCQKVLFAGQPRAAQ
ncbi:imidazolonepropionase [Porticoccus sp. W117]|uniref:imidazolonepropionase n=1 Tax=Porticoccus sp. W117 TaxID=3054777 RepID=UPI002597232D|nr:imidazolonepropionase [Porticoccus sp. W117]MDM3872432.1 imidazolonepropionase [Porticoccus sp. W117]